MHWIVRPSAFNEMVQAFPARMIRSDLLVLLNKSERRSLKLKVTRGHCGGKLVPPEYSTRLHSFLRNAIR